MCALKCPWSLLINLFSNIFHDANTSNLELKPMRQLLRDEVVAVDACGALRYARVIADEALGDSQKWPPSRNIRIDLGGASTKLLAAEDVRFFRLPILFSLFFFSFHLRVYFIQVLIFDEVFDF